MNRRRLPTTLTLLFALVLLTRAADAYQAFGYWPRASIIYDYHTLSSSWQSAVSYGSSRWNGISGSHFEWAPGTSGSNDIVRGSLDGAGVVLGVTTANLTDSSGNLLACGVFSWINIKFDSAEPWYTGSSTPSTSEMDLRSIAAHEFGHALGLLHTTKDCSLAESSRPTMCLGYSKGKTWKRSLEADDRAGAAFVYKVGKQTSPRGQALPQQIAVWFEYEELTLAKAAAIAERAVHGVVTDVSPTRWNQNSGEYWTDLSADEQTMAVALPYYEVTISLADDLRSGRRLRHPVVVTVLGFSPVDQEGSTLVSGTEIVAFLRSTQLTWRDGSKSILQLVGDPDEILLKRDPDGAFRTATPEKAEGLDLGDIRGLARQ